MNYRVRVYEIDRQVRGGPVPTGQLAKEFDMMAKNVDLCRRGIERRFQDEGRVIRTVSFSPDPEPHGSVIVYIFKEEQATESQPKRSRRGRK